MVRILGEIDMEELQPCSILQRGASNGLTSAKSEIDNLICERKLRVNWLMITLITVSLGMLGFFSRYSELRAIVHRYHSVRLMKEFRMTCCAVIVRL